MRSRGRAPMKKNRLILTTFLLAKQLCEKKKSVSHLSKPTVSIPSLEIVYG